MKYQCLKKIQFFFENWLSIQNLTSANILLPEYTTDIYNSVKIGVHPPTPMSDMIKSQMNF